MVNKSCSELLSEIEKESIDIQKKINEVYLLNKDKADVEDILISLFFVEITDFSIKYNSTFVSIVNEFGIPRNIDFKCSDEIHKKVNYLKSYISQIIHNHKS